MAVLQERTVFVVVLVVADFVVVVVVVCAWHCVLERWVELDLKEWVWLSEERDLLLLEGRGLSLVELQCLIQVSKLVLAAQAVKHITHTETLNNLNGELLPT